jgi:hypothetical protein
MFSTEDCPWNNSELTAQKKDFGFSRKGKAT